MPRRAARPAKPPTYRLHKARGCAVVTIDGRNHYLGKYGTPESHQKYSRLIAEWQAGFSSLPLQTPVSNGMTITDIVAAFWIWAEKHYTKDGQPTSELACLRCAFRPLVELYGDTAASKFGPLALNAVREQLIAQGLCRTTINGHINRIRRLFGWGTQNELIPPSVFHGLQAVTGLRRGRTAAHERPPPDCKQTCGTTSRIGKTTLLLRTSPRSTARKSPNSGKTKTAPSNSMQAA